jgi:hypothetical protein
MAPRLELQQLFEDLLQSENAYFQPPPSVNMQYPAIVYKPDFILPDHADNIPYLMTKRYLVTTIDRDPDSDLPNKIAALPMCSFDRFYTFGNLNHNVFKLFF